MPRHICLQNTWFSVISLIAGRPKTAENEKMFEKSHFEGQNLLKNNHKPTLFLNWAVILINIDRRSEKIMFAIFRHKKCSKIPFFDHWDQKAEKNAQISPNFIFLAWNLLNVIRFGSKIKQITVFTFPEQATLGYFKKQQKPSLGHVTHRADLHRKKVLLEIKCIGRQTLTWNQPIQVKKSRSRPVFFRATAFFLTSPFTSMHFQTYFYKGHHPLWPQLHRKIIPNQHLSHSTFSLQTYFFTWETQIMTSSNNIAL